MTLRLIATLNLIAVSPTWAAPSPADRFEPVARAIAATKRARLARTLRMGATPGEALVTLKAHYPAENDVKFLNEFEAAVGTDARRFVFARGTVHDRDFDARTSGGAPFVVKVEDRLNVRLNGRTIEYRRLSAAGLYDAILGELKPRHARVWPRFDLLSAAHADLSESAVDVARKFKLGLDVLGETAGRGARAMKGGVTRVATSAGATLHAEAFFLMSAVIDLVDTVKASLRKRSSNHAQDYGDFGAIFVQSLRECEAERDAKAGNSAQMIQALQELRGGDPAKVLEPMDCLQIGRDDNRPEVAAARDTCAKLNAYLDCMKSLTGPGPGAAAKTTPVSSPAGR